MRPLRFVFNWIAILTLPVWGGMALLYILCVSPRQINRAVLLGRKWIGEL